MGKAVFVERHGGPEVLELREHDPGAPKPGQVRVRVVAAGVNFIDTYLRTGAYARRTPFALGVEGAGVVETVGEGCGLAPGARVAWAQGSASYATHALLPEASVVPVPDDVELPLAAASMLQGMTAHYLVHAVRQSQPGDVALVHAAAGGTGQLLVQMLKAAGVRVIATCSTEQKQRIALERGADDVVRYDSVEFAPEVKRLTGGRGVDVAYDSVGKSTFDGSLASLRMRGLLVLYGQASGAVPPFDLQRLNQGGGLFVTRPSLAHYVATRAELVGRADAVLQGVRSGSLRVAISHRFPLEQARQAHRVLEARESLGKVLLNVA